MPGSKARPASGYRDRNSTADRALDILLLFNEDKLVWSGAEIADEIGVARSTGYRYMQSLVNAGFVEEASGGFRLGPRIFELARLARAGTNLTDIATPPMRSLSRAVGETVLLVEAPHPVRLSYERGHVLPINAGAAAEVLMAWAPPDEVSAVLKAAPLERFTAKTLTDPGQLQTRLAQIRRDGVAVSQGELDEQTLGVAAPIHNARGDVIAAVSVAALASRVPRSEIKSVKVAVKNTAATISEQLAIADI
jgi:DNA-binding IclR family transcriptional regulator